MLTWGGFTVNEDETQCTVDNDVDRTVINYFKDLRDRGLAHLYPYAEADKMSADLMNQDAAFFFQSTGGLSQMLSIADELGFGLQTAFIPKEPSMALLRRMQHCHAERTVRGTAECGMGIYQIHDFHR